MSSTTRTSIGYLLCAGIILIVTASLITAYAAEKSGNDKAKKAVVVNHPTSQTAARQKFEKMSPDELRDPVALDNFIRQFPDSDEARAAFALRYLLLKNNPIIDDYDKFIEQYPDKLQAQIALGELFDIYLSKNTVPGFYNFVSHHPDTIQTWVAIHHIEQIMFEFAVVCNTEEGFDAFIEAFPDAPQVRLADKEATKIAIDNEKKKYNEFLKNNPKATREDKKEYANNEISNWEGEINDIREDKDNKPNDIREDKDNKPNIINASFQLRALRWKRRSVVLRIVYGTFDDNGRIQATRNAEHISNILKEINNTLNKNHEELLKKLDEQTVIICNEICDKLEVLHKDNQQIIAELRQGFQRLHYDLKIIHTDLVDIKSTLDDMNRQLHIISGVLTAAATGGSMAINVSGYGFQETVKQITDYNRQKTDSNEPFSESRTMTTISCIAQNGYDNYPNVWKSNEAADVLDTINMYFHKIKFGCPIARYVGALAATAATTAASAAASKGYVSEDFVTIIEDLAPLIAKETAFTVDRFGIPVAKKVATKVKEAREFKWVFISESTSETYEDFKGDFWEFQKKVVKEEQDNLLKGGGDIADAFNIDRKWSDPVINAIKERDVNEIVIPWAKNLKVKPEIIDFYKQYLELTSEQ